MFRFVNVSCKIAQTPTSYCLFYSLSEFFFINSDVNKTYDKKWLEIFIMYNVSIGLIWSGLEHVCRILELVIKLPQKFLKRIVFVAEMYIYKMSYQRDFLIRLKNILPF